MMNAQHLLEIVMLEEKVTNCPHDRCTLVEVITTFEMTSKHTWQNLQICAQSLVMIVFYVDSIFIFIWLTYDNQGLMIWPLDSSIITN